MESSVSEYNLETFFEGISCLARGGYSIVCKAKSKKTFRGLPEGTLVALKLIDITKLNEEQINDIDREVSVLTRASSFDSCNNNVVCYYGKIVTSYRSRNYFVIVMEYIEGIPLSRLSNEKLSDDNLNNIIQQLLIAVGYIHSLQIVHRDIKPDNIIYDPRSGVVKLIDFGFSCYSVLYNVKYQCRMNTKGTPSYIAPEIWAYYLQGTKDITTDEDIEKLKKADMWSLGMSLYQLIYGITPYDDLDSVVEIANNVIYGDVSFYESEVDPVIIDVIENLLNKNYKERFSAEQAYNLLVS